MFNLAQFGTVHVLQSDFTICVMICQLSLNFDVLVYQSFPLEPLCKMYYQVFVCRHVRLTTLKIVPLFKYNDVLTQYSVF